MAHSSPSQVPPPTCYEPQIHPKCRLQNHTNARGQPVFPKSAQLVQEAKLNVGAFTWLLCNRPGETAQEAANKGISDLSVFRRQLQQRARGRADTCARRQVFPLSHMYTRACQTSLPNQVHGRGLGIPSWGGVSPAIPQNHTGTYSPVLIAGGSFQWWLRRRALPLTSCETLDKLLSFLEPQFPHLLNGDNEVPTS